MGDVGLHWQGMNKAPLEGKVSVESPYLSGKKPPSYQLPEGISIHSYEGTKLPIEVRKEICSFISENNVMATGNVTALKLEMVDKFAESGAYCGILRNTLDVNRPLMGTIFTLPVDLIYRGVGSAEVDGVGCVRLLNDAETSTSIKEHTEEGSGEGGNERVAMKLLIHSCYTSYLCVREDLRSHGVAMALIRCMMTVGWKYGVRSGYYMSSKPHHRCNLKISSWFRPLKPVESMKAGFQLPPINAPGHRDISRLYRMQYHMSIPQGYSASEYQEGSQHPEPYRTSWERGMKLCVSFSSRGMSSILSKFGGMWVLQSGVRRAFFILGDMQVRIGNHKKEVPCIQLSYFTVDPEADLVSVLKVVGTVALQRGALALYGYCMGRLTSFGEYAEYRALQCGGADNYLEIYNGDIELKPEQVNMLLL